MQPQVKSKPESSRIDQLSNPQNSYRNTRTRRLSSVRARRANTKTIATQTTNRHGLAPVALDASDFPSEARRPTLAVKGSIQLENRSDREPLVR